MKNFGSPQKYPFQRLAILLRGKRLECVSTLLAISGSVLLAAPGDEPQIAPQNGRQPVNRVRFFPAPGREKAMLGGKFSGSNISEREGYEVLGEISAVPAAGQWTELSIPNKKHYRWVRYEAPPGSYGNVAEMEFYAGDKKVGTNPFGSLGNRNFHGFQLAMDGKTDTFFDSDTADGQYVGVDVGYWCDESPTLVPAPGESKEPLKVTLQCSAPDAVIRYSFEGTPGPNDGLVYSSPIPIDHTATLFAVAYRKGFAPSPTTFGTYFVGASAKPGLSTFHIGNSLMAASSGLSKYAFTAGWVHDYHAFIIGGASNERIWETAVVKPTSAKAITTKVGGDTVVSITGWEQTLSSLSKLDHFALEVFDPQLEQEAVYEVKFLNTIRAKFPQMQPWLYSVWHKMCNSPMPNAVPLGQVPSFQMKTLYPAQTWEEATGAWQLYAEDVRTKVLETYTEGKKPRVLPSALAVAWLKNWVDHGKLPGITSEMFPFIMFHDNFHPGPIGQYLLDLTWYAAFYKESPVGKVKPTGTDLTPEQAAALQRLAWDVVKNYPDCGLYEEGITPVGKPAFSVVPGKINGVTPITLTSATEGAWFRYTLDGTEPTRTRGYVYCGVVSVRPGMTIKAVAYKSGMADSVVAAATYPEQASPARQ